MNSKGRLAQDIEFFPVSEIRRLVDQIQAHQPEFIAEFPEHETQLETIIETLSAASEIVRMQELLFDKLIGREY